MKTLKEFEEDGWEIDQEDVDRLESKKLKRDLNNSISAIAKAVKDLSSETKKDRAENVRTIEALIAAQVKMFNDVISKVKTHDKWEMDIKRNQKGFTSKIYLNAK